MTNGIMTKHMDVTLKIILALMFHLFFVGMKNNTAYLSSGGKQSHVQFPTNARDWGKILPILISWKYKANSMNEEFVQVKKTT